MGKTAKRLYEQFQPENYKLSLVPDTDAKRFNGTVTITGKKTGRPSQRITFHQKDLKVTSAAVKRLGKDAGEIKIDRINAHASSYEVRLHAASMLYPGMYEVTLEFEGKITPTMTGIYLCDFEHKGTKKHLVATQFESHHAREAFPCIDEPEAKATFDLTVIANKGDVALGNMPALKQTEKDGKLITTFETTPRMSAYLLAFVTGEMQSVEGKTKDGIVVRSWSSVAQDKSHLEYSAKEAVSVLEFYTDYFGVAYPLAKLDQVALPDFEAGAMENWGLVTYREIALLADPKNRSVSNEQYVSLVVAHELAHQWFGDLVTMKWWDDLWLNESFASLMEHLALDIIHSDWHQWEFFTASDVISTSSRDVYSDVQSVSVQVTDPDLIPTLFDPSIVYAKGARLLKMLRDHIGDEAFAKGLQAYFKEYAYKNATRDDLWKFLSKSSKKDIGKLMDPWLIHSGMPILEVSQKGQTLEVSQERFLLDAEDDYLWPVPLLADKTLSTDLLDGREATITVSEPGYVLLNPHGSGHYFTHYAEQAHRDYLTERLQSRELPPEARINVLNDAYMLARKGAASLIEALDIIKDCRQEDRDNVWAAISRIVVATSQLTEGDEASDKKIKALRRRLMTDWYDKLGWEDKPTDDGNTKQLRHTAIAYMVSGEDKAAIDKALELYAGAKSLQTLPAELRSSILSVAVKHGPRDAVERLLKAYPKESADIQLDITSALASTKDPKVAEHIYSKALGTKGFVRSQDMMRWLVVFIRNPHIRKFVWQYIQDEWEWIEGVLKDSKSFDFLPIYCASAFNSAEWEKEFHNFFEPKRSEKLLERNIAVGYADIAARVAWRKREEKKLAAWLAEL